MVDIKPLKDQDNTAEPEPKSEAAAEKPQAEAAPASSASEVKSEAPTSPEPTKTDNTDDLQQQIPDQKKKKPVEAVKMSADELLSSQKYFVSIKQQRQKLSPMLLFPLLAVIAILAVSLFGVVPEIDNIPTDKLEDLRSQSRAKIEQDNKEAEEKQQQKEDEAAALEQAEKENEAAAQQAEEELAQISERNIERKNDIDNLQVELEKIFGDTSFYPKYEVFENEDLPDTEPDMYVSPSGVRIAEGSALEDNNNYYYQTSECDDQGCAKYVLSVTLEPVGEEAQPELYERASVN